MSTPNRLSCRAIASFSSFCREIPGDYLAQGACKGPALLTDANASEKERQGHACTASAVRMLTPRRTRHAGLCLSGRREPHSAQQDLIDLLVLDPCVASSLRAVREGNRRATAPTDPRRSPTNSTTVISLSRAL
jgi:hypothetical protein